MRARSKQEKSEAVAEVTKGEMAPQIAPPPPPTGKAKRSRKRDPNQREMLLPISGGAAPQQGLSQRLPSAAATLDLTPSPAIPDPAPRNIRPVRVAPGPPPLGARTLGMLDTLKYLVREWEDYGVIDATNMRHVYWAIEESKLTKGEAFLPLASNNEVFLRAASPKSMVANAAKRSPIVRTSPTDWFEPQVCKSAEKAPIGEDWVHEIRFDGFRLAARIDHGHVQLFTASGLDRSERYPEIAAALSRLPLTTAYIDGELCGDEPEGNGTPVYYAFDLIELDGAPTRRLRLLERKKWLAALLKHSPVSIAYSDHDADEETVREAARRRGFKGIVSKRVDDPYSPGNRSMWVESLNNAG
jgi:ATP dependent DNA ligase domain